MSADNGIYILVTPTEKEHRYTYRVAHAMAIGNIYYYEDGPLSDATIVKYFGKCEVLTNKRRAIDLAYEMKQVMEDDGCCIEYGVSVIQWGKPFPNMTKNEAETILQCEHDRVYEETYPGSKYYRKRDGVDPELYRRHKRQES